MLQTFYADILIPDSQLVVATLKEKKIQHHVLEDSGEVITFLEQFQDHNAYHSLGAYEGLPSGATHEVQNLPGCTGCRAFGFDLDVGEEPGKYDSLEDAFTSLTTAVETGYCPEPTWLVFSGGGIQFYYVVGGKLYDKGLPEKAWRLSFQRIRAHLKSKLKIDPTVGSAPYRLLRSPCTPNYKYEDPVQPEILSEQRGPYITLDWIKSLPKVKAIKPTASGKADQPHRVQNPVVFKNVQAACAAIRHEAQTQGATTLEPVWLAAANICAHTFEYRRAFHELSSGHPEYSVADTDAKFDHVRQNVAAGPIGCSYFGDPDDPESPCHGCWAAKQGLPNPISATRHFNPDPPPLPASKKAVLDEIAEEIEDDVDSYNEDGEKLTYGIPASQMPADMSVTNLGIMNAKGEFACSTFWVKPFHFNEHDEKGSISISRDRGKNWYTFPASKLGTPQGIASELANIGVMVKDPKATAEYVSQAAYTEKHINEMNSFGWDEHFESFYTPSGMIGDSEATPASRLIRLSDTWGGSAGDLDTWIEAVGIYDRAGQEPYLMTLLASIASPLLSYYGLEKGVILSLTGAGGAGKTSALKVASSVWGRGVPSLVGTASTPVALRAAIAQCSNLPMIYDDITQMATDELKQLALEISQGTGRARGNIDGSLQAFERWHLVFLTTSNLSLHSRLAELVDQGSADMNRVIELKIGPSREVSAQQGATMLDAVQDNYGLLGPAFIEHVLLLDRDKEVAKARKLLAQLRARDGLQGSDRFVDNLIIACYLVHVKMKALYPSFPGDPDSLLTWMRTQLRQNNKNIESILAIRVPDVDDFIMAYAVEDLIITKNGPGYMKQGNSLKGYVYDYEEFYLIPRDVFTGWCRRNNLMTRTVLEKWGHAGRIVNHAASNHQNRWSGKFKEGIILDGIKSYPNVIMARKTHGTIKTVTSARSGNVTQISQAADHNR